MPLTMKIMLTLMVLVAGVLVLTCLILRHLIRLCTSIPVRGKLIPS